MFANSIKCSWIQKIFLILENVRKFVKVFMNLKNIHDFIYVDEFRKCSWFYEIQSDSVCRWCSKKYSWPLEIMIFFFFPLQSTSLLLVVVLKTVKNKGKDILPVGDSEEAKWSYCVLRAKDATHGPNSGQRDTK